MRILHNCGRLEVRESPIEGFGVFATDTISAGEILEEVPFILFPRNITLGKMMHEVLSANGWESSKENFMENLRNNMGFKHPDRYYFKWQPPTPLDQDSMFTVLPLGFGPVYNTSNTANNADWKALRDTFIFKADKDIAKDEEIRTFYGYFISETGTIFNCDQVFNLGIDMFDVPNGKIHRIKVLRFGSMESLQTQRNNPAAVKFNALMTESAEGLTIKSIHILGSNGTVVAGLDIPEFADLSFVYSKLQEAYRHPAPIVKITVSFRAKIIGTEQTQEVVWKK